MEPVVQEIGSSTITVDDESLTITIPSNFWTKRQWQWLVKLIVNLVVSGMAWVMAPIARSVEPSSQSKPAARWKQMSFDGLSYLLFVLMIPKSHGLRKLFDAIDWHKIDEQCAAVYKNGAKGAPAYPPQVLFRILVLMFYSGTPFESATLQRLETDVAWRWFVGLSLLCPIPDAGTLSRFRTRLGVSLFEQILIDLIESCQEAGLIGHLESYYDMTGVEASATQITPYQRAVILAKALSAYLDEAQGGMCVISREQVAAIALEVLQEKHPSLEKVSASQIVSSQDKLEEKLAQTVKSEPKWWQRLHDEVVRMCEQLKGGRELTSERLHDVARELLASLPQAFGNPDATVGHTRTNGTICGYRSGFLADAKHWIITAVVFAGLDKGEAPTVIKALDKHYEIFGSHPKNLGLDSAFDRDEVHRYTKKHEIYSGVTVRSRPGAAGVFHVDAFIWNEQGQLLCPNDEIMEKVGGPYKDGTERYRAIGQCSQCPLLDKCLSAKQQEKKEIRREFRINTGAHQRAQENRERSRSPEGRALRRRRFASEGIFGHLNRFHNGDKAPYRNGSMDHIAQLMVAYVSNLEKLAAYA